jgi:hypothetical protein
VRLTTAQIHRENQFVLKTANKEAQAKTAKFAEERKKKIEEEEEAAKAAEAEKTVEAAQRLVSEKEVLDFMESDDDEECTSLEGLVRHLEKETDMSTASPQKKISRNKEVTSKK